MAATLGEMKGAAMKLGQLASFVDTEFLLPEYAELYQEELAKLRTSAPSMPWEKVSKVLEEEYRGEPLDELFAEIEQEAFAAASIGQYTGPRCTTAARSRSRSSTPGRRRGARVGPAHWG